MTVLTTERLILRPLDDGDLPQLAAFFATDRSKWVGGPATAEDVADSIATAKTYWQENGFGHFTIILKDSDLPIGRIALLAHGNRPEPELAYALYAPEHEGKGYATEAAEAVLDLAYNTLGFERLVSYIDATNATSIALAERVGAELDEAAPKWDRHPEALIYRHPKPVTAPLDLSLCEKASPTVAALTAHLPEIKTERLTLRSPRLSDWPVLEPIWTTQRAKYIGGICTPEEAWLDFNHLVASWLLRGFGALTITRKADGAVLGVVLIEHEMGDPEPELGWLLTAEAEGHGYAREAAAALLPIALNIFGSGNLVSYIHRDNKRSRKLAEGLGATVDQKRHPAFAAGLVYRHFGMEAHP